MKLTLNNISFAYDTDRVIKNIACSFYAGHFYSILGPNGSGKTTLLDLLSGFLTPTAGHIDLDDRPILSFSKNSIAKQVALVSQDYTINFPFRVKDVVMMGRHPHIPRFSQPTGTDEQKVQVMMEVTGILHLQDRKITELSGGERQRCVFARALCQDTQVLLLDEAFSNMDINHTLQMLSLVKQSVKNKNKLVISVFHDLNMASAWSDELLMLKNGEIIAYGPSQEILSRETIKSVFNVDSIVEFNPHVQARQVYYPSI